MQSKHVNFIQLGLKGGVTVVLLEQKGELRVSQRWEKMDEKLTRAV